LCSNAGTIAALSAPQPKYTGFGSLQHHLKDGAQFIIDAFLHEKAVFMEKPYMLTAFLHDIGLFVEKHLSASSIKCVQAFRLSLHTLGAMPGCRICWAWCYI
jgi:hypothetical protein